MHFYDEHNEVLSLVFSNIIEHLRMLDTEGDSTDTARYINHRRYVDEMLLGFDFVVGTTLLGKHYIIPLMKGDAHV